MTVENIIALFGLGGGVLGVFFYSIRKLTSMEFTIVETGKIRHANLLHEVNRNREQFVETIQAIRAHSDNAHKRVDQLMLKIQEVELYIRDHYVQDGTFEEAISRLRDEINRSRD